MKSPLLLLFQLVLFLRGQSEAGLRFASPLQTLTVWDKGNSNAPTMTPRERFLERYRAGLEAQRDAKEKLDKQFREYLSKQNTEAPDWDKRAAALERRQKARIQRLTAQAYERGVKAFDQKEAAAVAAAARNRTCQAKDPNKYQFVGVIDRKKDKSKPVTWYARKKPAGATWSVRLVHVNQDAIVKDLYDRGKVDIMASYKNTGKTEKNSRQRLVTAQYTAKERSWRTFWNFSPKAFFTDSSGMYWRERRLRPGLYTDGSMVYETAYRYRDGRNGMLPKKDLEQHFRDVSYMDPNAKKKVLKKLRNDPPDIVLESKV